jgi:hypothetical protein
MWPSYASAFRWHHLWLAHMLDVSNDCVALLDTGTMNL